MQSELRKTEDAAEKASIAAATRERVARGQAQIEQKGRLAAVSGREQARRAHEQTRQRMNRENQEMLNKLSLSRAQTLQVGEITAHVGRHLELTQQDLQRQQEQHRAEIGYANTREMDIRHGRDIAEATRESATRARHVSELGTEKVKSASLRDEIMRRQKEADRLLENERRIGTGLIASQDLENEKHRLKIFGLQKQIDALEKAGKDQTTAGKLLIVTLEDKIQDVQHKLTAAESSTQVLQESAKESAKESKKQRRRERRREREPRAAAAPPIVVQGGAGGGGASSSAGGSSAAAGGPAAGPAARAPDLSKVLEAVKQIAASKGKGAKGSTKGITQARRTYTDKRKAKIAELRALKSKRIREFAAKTKKLPSAERKKQRREFKKRVEAQFREMQTRFPTARGLKSVGVLRELIRKIDAFKSAK